MIRYHREHVWVKVEEASAWIGLTFYAQAHLGEIVYLDLPPAGKRLTMDRPFGEIESAKTTSELTAPVSGTVLESNLELEAHPGLINESPLEKGWIAKVGLADAAELDLLMDHEAYQAYLEAENQEKSQE
ncbi:MAG: glycine cleavage system protein GcvH [Pseudomonadota bacterium]